jgi:hypothetical protein
MTPSLCRRALALALTVPLTLSMIPVPAHAAETADFAGRVFQSDGITPRAGVVVALYDSSTEQTFRSQPTSDEGSFRISEAPAGSYALVAEAGEVAFLADENLELQAGTNPPLALTLQTAPGYDTSSSKPSSGMKPWAKWLIAGVIGVAALGLIYNVTKETETSPGG